MHTSKIQAPPKKLSLKCGNRILTLNNPVVMGIINVTPDSFFDISRINNEKAAIAQAENMLKNGAVMVDIGGYSSRPGADEVPIEAELKRVIPIVKQISKLFPELFISVDTFRADIAYEAVQAGAHIINDISSGEDDPKMFDVVAQLKTPYVMMHKRGTPKTMQAQAQYNQVTQDILEYFIRKIELARQHQIFDLMIDPGFGFSKTLEHNYTLLNQLTAFNSLGQPILVGVSRKKMIQTITQTDANGALNGTTAANTLALINGANILRVHDVKEAIECINIVKAYHGNF